MTIEPNQYDPTDDPVNFTDAAALKVDALICDEENPNLKLRAGVVRGSSTALLSMKNYRMAIPRLRTRVSRC